MKILADQFLAAPFFAITFVFGMGILEDKRLSECWNEFLLKFPAIYLVSLGAAKYRFGVVQILLQPLCLIYWANKQQNLLSVIQSVAVNN